MRTTINRFQLLELEACKEGLDTFVSAHGRQKNVKLSETLSSNTLSDVSWLVSNLYYEGFSDKQRLEISDFVCEKGKSILHVIDENTPYYKQFNRLLEKKMQYVKGEIDFNVLCQYKNETMEHYYDALKGNNKSLQYAMMAVLECSSSAPNLYSVVDNLFKSGFYKVMAEDNCDLDQYNKSFYEKTISSIKDLFLAWEQESSLGEQL